MSAVIGSYSIYSQDEMRGCLAAKLLCVPGKKQERYVYYEQARKKIRLLQENCLDPVKKVWINRYL